jgi:hypothetical protein
MRRLARAGLTRTVVSQVDGDTAAAVSTGRSTWLPNARGPTGRQSAVIPVPATAITKGSATPQRPYCRRVAVDRTWRSPDRALLVDQVVDEPGVQYRLWDSEGLPIGEARSPGELERLLASFGTPGGQLEEVPVDDPWCE